MLKDHDEVNGFTLAIGDGDRDARLRRSAVCRLPVIGCCEVTRRLPEPVCGCRCSGFAAVPLPVVLPNVNCVRYPVDGRLFVGTFGGKIYTSQAADRGWRWPRGNGDHLLERFEPGRRSPPRHLQPGSAARRWCPFVATMGKILLVRDTDGDGRGDNRDRRERTLGACRGLPSAVASMPSGWRSVATARSTSA